MAPSNLRVAAIHLPAFIFLSLLFSMPSHATTRSQDSLVRIDTIPDFPSAILGRSRTIRVVLPPEYSGNRLYPVLLMNDGQDLEAMRFQETLDSLYRRNAIQPFILVAIHATEARTQEYGVAGIPNAQGLGTEAGAYARFLLEELLPEIRVRYRITRLPEKTVIMGMSLGGLSAFDLAWQHSEAFGSVGVFSGSFWWRTNDSTAASKQASRIMHRVVGETAEPPELRIWLEAGRQDEQSDRDSNGVIDAIQDTRELMAALTRKGFRRGFEMTYLEMDGGHNPATWGRALPRFLTWAFQP